MGRTHEDASWLNESAIEPGAQLVISWLGVNLFSGSKGSNAMFSSAADVHHRSSSVLCLVLSPFHSLANVSHIS